jgi:hypothetical protein
LGEFQNGDISELRVIIWCFIPTVLITTSRKERKEKRGEGRGDEKRREKRGEVRREKREKRRGEERRKEKRREEKRRGIDLSQMRGAEVSYSVPISVMTLTVDGSKQIFSFCATTYIFYVSMSQITGLLSCPFPAE